MPVVRRFCSLLIVLALALGAVLPMAHANGSLTPMAMAAGMDQPMPDDCDGCDDDMTQASCLQAACIGMAAVLPRSDAPALPVSSAFAVAPDQCGAGLSGFPDPHPPRSPLLV
ncbi:MAG: hypothetical protein AB7O13_03095 [Alphaproteobacteria bacterium]